jgi:hypothetical protein
MPESPTAAAPRMETYHAEKPREREIGFGRSAADQYHL